MFFIRNQNLAIRRYVFQSTIAQCRHRERSALFSPIISSHLTSLNFRVSNLQRGTLSSNWSKRAFWSPRCCYQGGYIHFKNQSCPNMSAKKLLTIGFYVWGYDQAKTMRQSHWWTGAKLERTLQAKFEAVYNHIIWTEKLLSFILGAALSKVATGGNRSFIYDREHDVNSNNQVRPCSDLTLRWILV